MRPPQAVRKIVIFKNITKLVSLFEKRCFQTLADHHKKIRTETALYILSTGLQDKLEFTGCSEVNWMFGTGEISDIG